MTADIKDLLKKHGFRFSKALGQNFLIDGNITKKIVESSGVDESCGVLEVGPGAGALTRELSSAAGRVTAVELDRRLLPVLEDTLKGRENVEVVHGDVLKIDIKKLVYEKMPGLKHQVCANLPYNITTPAIAAFVNSGVFISITVMVQKEVALRICAEPGSPEYGAFSVFVNYHMEPKILFDVPPECFFPRPGVCSSVITMKSRPDKTLDPDGVKVFFSVVRAAFAQRRKTLVNALYSAFGNAMSKEDIADIVTNCGFDARIRGETLGIEDFFQISAKFLSFRYKSDAIQ